MKLFLFILWVLSVAILCSILEKTKKVSEELYSILLFVGVILAGVYITAITWTQLMCIVYANCEELCILPLSPSFYAFFFLALNTFSLACILKPIFSKGVESEKSKERKD